MRPTSTPPCGAGLNAIRASTSTSPRPPGSTWSSACSPISPVVVCVGDAFAVSPNSNQRSDATLTTATPLPNRSFGPKGPTPSFENTNGLNGTLFRGRDTSRYPFGACHAGIRPKFSWWRCLVGTWSETPAWFRTKLFVASDASIALSFSDVSDAHQFFTSPLRSSNNLDYRANPPHGRNTDIGCR